MSPDLALQRREIPASPANAQTEDDLALEHIERAEKALEKWAVDGPLKAFFTGLFRGAPPEDITRYSPESLAVLAKLVFECSTRRAPSETLVNVFQFPA